MEASALPTIDDAIQGFLNQLSVGKQPNTVRAYGVTLSRFQKYLQYEHGLPVGSNAKDLTVDHVIGFAQSLKELSPATIRNYLAALSQFYRYLFSHRLVAVDMAEHERLFTSIKQMRPRSDSLPHVPTDDVIDALVRAAGMEDKADHFRRTHQERERSNLRRLRNVALLLALKSSGMRLGEALALRRGDLDYRTRAAMVTGKGRKQWIVYFDGAAWSAIQEYLQARQDGARSRAIAQNPVFVRHGPRSGKELRALTHQRVEQIFAELAARCEIDPAPTPHWLRHWFATRVLERTQDLAAVQDLLGHASPVTTRIYAKVSGERLREAHRASFEKDGERHRHTSRQAIDEDAPDDGLIAGLTKIAQRLRGQFQPSK